MKNINQIKAAVLAQNPDLKRFRAKKLAVFFLKLAGLEALAVALTAALLSHKIVAAIPIGVVLALLLPFLVLKAHKFFVFGVRLGKVVEVKIVQRRADSQRGWLWGYASMTDRQFAVFKLEDEKGHTSYVELEARFHACIYEGDVLLRLAGVPYPINLKRHTKALCPICGNIMPRESTRCVGCDADVVQTLGNFEEVTKTRSDFS
ncbi:MAG: hypothetical protein IKJ35_02265 [Clostridia bacterium]|nr:hypothetical protein [Clostridia bacterium]